MGVPQNPNAPHVATPPAPRYGPGADQVREWSTPPPAPTGQAPEVVQIGLPEAPVSVTAKVDFYGCQGVLLTVRGLDGPEVLTDLARTLEWMRSSGTGATPQPQTSMAPAPMPVPAQTYAPAPQAPAPQYQNGAGYPPPPQANGHQAPQVAMTCPTHGGTLKQSKNRPNEWFCPFKVADDGGNGRPVYCKHKVTV